MAHSKLSGAVITYTYDDGNTQDYTVTYAENAQGGRVEISDGGDLLYIYEELWEIMREQIDGLFEQAQEDN